MNHVILNMSFENLSQGELIHLATILRVDYKGKIDKYLFDELNVIVHHHEKTNPYYGDWNIYRKNCVIHQIFNKIIPKEERDQFIKKHPTEIMNERLIEIIKERDFYINDQQKDLIAMKRKEASIEKKISDYENIKNMNDKEKAEFLESSWGEILNLISIQRHWETTIFAPLVTRGWLNPMFLELPGKDSGGWGRFCPEPDYMGSFNPYENHNLIYNPVHSIPFRLADGTGIRNEDILDVILPSIEDVNYIVELRNKLMIKCKALTEENKNLTEDNKKLLKIIQNNKIDI